MNIKKLINEEIEDLNKDLLNIEGVADKYAERAFGMPDPNTELEKTAAQSQNQQPIDNKGELVAKINRYDDKGNNADTNTVNIYRNPKSLEDFGHDVKAVSDKDGNLFVAQFPDYFHHDAITDAVTKVGKYNIGQGYDAVNNMTWVRDGQTDSFEIGSISYTYLQNHYKNGIQRIQALQQKQPFKFQNQFQGVNTQTEGVADKYAEKQFNIPDPNTEKERQSLTGLEQLPQDDKGELLGNTGGFSKSKVYANPKSLKDFESEVRAVVDKKGNLFVAQLNGHFYHDNLVTTVNNSKGKYNKSLPNDAYYSYEDEVLLHRVGKTNMFGLSDSYETFASMYPEIVQDLLKIAESKNPQFKFYPIYYNNYKFFGDLNKKNNNKFTTNEDNENGKIDNSNETGKIDNSNETGKIAEIVKEELGEFVKNITNKNEGVADKYAEKQFNIPDPNIEMNRKAQQGLEKNPENGQLVGIIKGREPKEYYGGGGGKKQYPGTLDTQIYKNPKSLKNFEADVKALSNAEGNLYVALQDTDIYHASIVNAVNDGNSGDELEGAYIEDLNVTWHRVGQTNNFGFSISYRDFGIDQRNADTVKSLIDIVKRKNLSFTFIPEYWENLKNNPNNNNPDNNNNNPDSFDVNSFNKQVKMVKGYSESKNFNANHNGFRHNNLNTFHTNNNNNLNQEGVVEKNKVKPKFNDNFWKWFGNSKVVKNGKPLIMHHGGSFSPSKPKEAGTSQPFNEFKGVGWFTSNKTDARYYSKQSGGDNLTSVYLKIENPLYSGKQEDGSYIETNNAVLLARKSNSKYDGVIHIENGNILDAIVWNSKQIKSIENNGEYNPSEIDVLKEDNNVIVDGVADKYAEKQFNIPDPNKAMDTKAIAGMEADDSVGDIAGYITNYEYYEYSDENETIPIKVYVNPKTLKDFDGGVRAVSHDKDGNLFVAQSDNSFYHSDLGNAVNNEGKYNVGRAYDVNENITWYRVANMDKFRYSGTFTMHMGGLNENKLLKALELVRAKNPNYEFIEDSVYQR